jgi:hypothetical protein
MSFSYNPLKHVEIVDDPPHEGYSNSTFAPYVDIADTYAIYCHGCGNSKYRIRKDAPISQAFEIVALHIEQSHPDKKQWMETWSTY